MPLRRFSQSHKKSNGGEASTPTDHKSSQHNIRKLLGTKDDEDSNSATTSTPSGSTSPMSICEPPTQTQINIVRQSWEKVSETRLPDDDPNISPAHSFALAFYDALFELCPETRSLFQNILLQARALSGMVSYIARSPAVAQDRTNGRTIKEINARKRAKDLDSSQTNNYSDDEEDSQEKLEENMRKLGARHSAYGIQPCQLNLAGPSFVAALKNRLGADYTDEIGMAWLQATSHAAYHMRVQLESQLAWEQNHSSNESVQDPKGNRCTLQ